MNPRIVLVICEKGVRLVRLVVDDYDHNDTKALALYGKIKPLINKIDKLLRN